MPILLKLANLFDIRPEERKLTGSLMLVGFFMGLTFVFIQVPALALFVETFGSEGLPLLYIAVAGVSTTISYIYLLVGSRLPFSALLVLNFGFIFTGTLAIRYLLAVESANWPLFFLPIWFEVVTTLGWIGFGTLQNRLFDVRQGRRLLGVVRMTVPGANILGGLTISLLAQVMETRDLFFISAGACIVLLWLLATQVLRVYRDRLTTQPEDDRRPSRRTEARSQSRLRRRYILSIFALIVVWWVAFYFIDNIFYDLLEQEFPTRAQIAAFLGVFFGMVQGSLLLLGNLFTSRIIRRVGMRASVLVMPVVITVCVIGLIAASRSGAAILTLFAFGAAAKLANGAIGFSVDTNARLLLYQPLPVDERARIQTIGQGIVEPLAIGLVGAILLLLTNGYGFGALELAQTFIGVAVLWIIVTIFTLRTYPQALKQAIVKRRLGESAFNLTDRASIRLLRNELGNPYPEAVIYSLSMLAQLDAEYLKSRLPGLLDHPAPEVRQEALGHIEALNVYEAIDSVEKQINEQSPPVVRQAALSTLVALGGHRTFKAVSAFLEHPDPRIQRGAIAGLLRYGGDVGWIIALRRIEALVESRDPGERLVVAETLQEVAEPDLNDIIHKLIYDNVLDVRRAAVLAAGNTRHPALWEDVLHALELPGLRTEAVQALVTGGEDALSEIIRHFNRGNRGREVKVRLARALGRIGGEQAMTFLRSRIAYPDEEVRTQILASLSACNYLADEESRPRIEAQIRAEARTMARTLAISADLQRGDDHDGLNLLLRSLQNDIDQARERIFYLLSTLYDRRAMLQARNTLAHGSAQQQAYALEMVETTVSRQMRTYLIPLLDTIPLEQRIQGVRQVLDGPDSRSREEHLRHLIRIEAEDQNPWMTLYALYAASQMGDPRYNDVIAETARAPDLLIRETALWALEQIDPEAHRELEAFLGVPGAQFDRETPKEGEKTVYSTIEKLVILKTISIFEETPSDVLVDIADLMDVVDVKEGETVITRGDIGHTMYVIVTGQMRVHDGDVTLNTLGDRDVFGELALLDPEPRAASVTALEDTILFRLDQEPFYELIADRGEVARGIMKVLVRTIRASSRDLSASGGQHQ